MSTKDTTNKNIVLPRRTEARIRNSHCIELSVIGRRVAETFMMSATATNQQTKHTNLLQNKWPMFDFGWMQMWNHYYYDCYHFFCSQCSNVHVDCTENRVHFGANKLEHFSVALVLIRLVVLLRFDVVTFPTFSTKSPEKFMEKYSESLRENERNEPTT